MQNIEFRNLLINIIKLSIIEKDKINIQCWTKWYPDELVNRDTILNVKLEIQKGIVVKKLKNKRIFALIIYHFFKFLLFITHCSLFIALAKVGDSNNSHTTPTK